MIFATECSLIVWLAGYYRIDLEAAHVEEMAEAAAFQELFFTSQRKKKKGFFLVKFLRLVKWFFITRVHRKKVEEFDL